MIFLATMTSATASAYLARAQNLLAAATRANGNQPPSPIEIVDWFLSSHDRWAPSTIRQYRSALRYFFGVLIYQNSERAEKIQPALNRLQEVVVAPSNELSHGERARPRPSAKKNRLTSATKRRTLNLSQAQALDQAFAGLRHWYAPLARAMTRLSQEFGLRPIEWTQAWLKGATLVVTNAKCTNNRGNGAIRTLDLSAYKPAVLAEIQGLLDAIDAALAVRGASWGKIHAGIQRAVRAASIQTGIVALRIKPACPYTARHVAAARLKASFDRSTVAAMLGHATDETAMQHYARAYSARGWKRIRMTVAADAVARVRLVYRPFDISPSTVVSTNSVENRPCPGTGA